MFGKMVISEEREKAIRTTVTSSTAEAVVVADEQPVTRSKSPSITTEETTAISEQISQGETEEEDVQGPIPVVKEEKNAHSADDQVGETSRSQGAGLNRATPLMALMLQNQ